MKVKKAVIPCAGLGTRFLPITKVMPKELLPIANLPALTYIIDEAIDSGIDEILIVISKEKEIIKDYFSENKKLNDYLLSSGNSELYNIANKKYNAKISFTYQDEMNGNGMAVYSAKDFAGGEPIAVLFGDDVMFSDVPVTKQLIDAYEISNSSIVGCQISGDDIAKRCSVMVPKYSITDSICELSQIIEKPNSLPSNITSLGRFILTSNYFDYVLSTKSYRNGEIYLTEVLNNMINSQEKVCSCLFNGKHYDIGNKEGYLEAVVEFSLRDPNLKSQFAKYLNNCNK